MLTVEIVSTAFSPMPNLFPKAPQPLERCQFVEAPPSQLLGTVFTLHSTPPSATITTLHRAYNPFCNGIILPLYNTLICMSNALTIQASGAFPVQIGCTALMTRVDLVMHLSSSLSGIECRGYMVHIALQSVAMYGKFDETFRGLHSPC